MVVFGEMLAKFSMRLFCNYILFYPWGELHIFIPKQMDFIIVKKEFIEIRSTHTAKNLVFLAQPKSFPSD